MNLHSHGSQCYLLWHISQIWIKRDMILLMLFHCCCWELSKKSTFFWKRRQCTRNEKKKKECLRLKNSSYSLLLPILNQVLMHTVTACLHDLRKKCFLFWFGHLWEIQWFLWNKQLIKSTTYVNQYGTSKTICIPLHVRTVHIKPVIFVLGNQRYHSDPSDEQYDLILTG